MMGNNPSEFKGDALPVERASWEDAQAFIEKLNRLTGKTTYCLPTEAQWGVCGTGRETPGRSSLYLCRK
ncbi:MAG: SUMF1/EgtB/PvdO family nonheme iron enzyme [Bacteroidia bacterium]|nr:SUMF1/EgtB/PvdO family nonheme iron enzyme [Bacteroidia bacterium]